ncbi:MAG: hypothetical protein WCR80_04080 [Bacilli bacterium]
MKKLKYLLLLLILSFFGINQVSAKNISLEDLVMKINSNNYGDFYVGQLKENYTDIFMQTLSSIDEGSILVDGSMSLLSDPYDYIWDSIEGNLNDSILIFNIFYGELSATSFNHNAPIIIQPLIINEETSSSLRLMYFEDEATEQDYENLKYVEFFQ